MEPQNGTIEVAISGIDCPSCAAGIEGGLRRIGVKKPHINVATSSLHLASSEQVPVTDVIAEIERLGYKAKLLSSDQTEFGRRDVDPSLWYMTIFCGILTLPLLLAMVIPWEPLHSGWVQLVLSVPVVGVAIYRFGSSALKSIRARLPNMDLMIIIGVLASFGYSLAALLLNLGHNYLFFETAATITTLVLVGNLLEERSMHKAASAIEELSKIQPVVAKKLSTANGSEEITTISAGAVKIGDLLRVNNGDQIPVDAEIVVGEGRIDESLVTGESVPVERGVGQKVIAGTVLHNGTLTIRASAVGQHTVLAQIIHLVRQAQSDRPEIQRIGDIVSAYFTPLAVIISLSTFFLTVWFTAHGVGESLLRAVAVLVIACPCAMGLATPTAVMIGIGRAARTGMLVRGGSTLERLAKLSTVVFDKTGTLTSGQFSIRSFAVHHGNEEDLRRIIKSLEQHSSHPIAQSIVREWSNVPSMSLSSVNEMNGRGIRGTSGDGRSYYFGSAALKPASVGELPEADLYLFDDTQLLASLVIEDALRPDAAHTLATLKNLGYEPVLLSGDREQKCRYVAERVGITKVFSQKSPDEKLKIIDELQRTGPVAFVGDGVNDAPALAKASVGIALSDATRVAIQSAEVILLKGNLSKLVECLALSKASLRTIKQNLFWAFSYNIVAIPIAALGYLNPMVAAFAMGFSDVMTIGNSLRLRTKRL